MNFANLLPDRPAKVNKALKPLCEFLVKTIDFFFYVFHNFMIKDGKASDSSLQSSEMFPHALLSGTQFFVFHMFFLSH